MVPAHLRIWASTLGSLGQSWQCIQAFTIALSTLVRAGKAARVLVQCAFGGERSAAHSPRQRLWRQRPPCRRRREA